MNKVLITGGTGFVGFHLARFLHAQGNHITLCDNLFRGKMDEDVKQFLEQEQSAYVECDLTNPDHLNKLDSGYDHVYHFAAINGTRNFYEIPDQVLRVNVLAAINTLDWFSQSKSKKILFSSSSETYAGTHELGKLTIPTSEDAPLCIEDIQNERMSYASSKIVGESLFINYARTRKFDASIVRYHNIYGPRMGFDHVIPEFSIRATRQENPFVVYGGDQTRAFCYVEDAIDATQKVMESAKTNGEIVHVGTQDEIKIIDLAKKVIKLANYNPKFDIKAAPKGSVMRRCPSIAKLTQLTGYQPRFSIDEGLQKTFAWYHDRVDQAPAR